MAALSSVPVPAAAASGSCSLSSSMRKKPGMVYIEGLNSFGGLKARNRVSSLGLPTCTDRSFAGVVNSLRVRAQSRAKRSRGGALSSTCNAAAEIFRIAAIMNGLVLVGVAVGFVILRVETALEESE